jgi:hypothetical protein
LGLPIHAQVDVFDVQNDVRHVLEHTWQRRKLVKHPFDLRRGDCRTLQRRQQDPPQRIEGGPSAGHARALLAAADLAAEVVRRGLNVRATERLIQRRAKVPRNPQTRAVDTTTLERELSAALGLRVTIESKSVAAP